MDIAHSTALVTGANRGIGRALVHALLAAGAAKVFAAARSVEKLDGLLGDRRIVAVPLDVTSERSVSALAERAGDVTLLINNAGVLDFGTVLETPREAFERNFGTNFYGVLSMSRSFAPVIERNGGGAIVNILTLVALASMPGLGVYNASKAAAWSLSQSLRAGLASRMVAVHSVFPGAVDTDMLAGVDMPKTSPADVARAIVDGVAKSVEDIFPDPMSASVYEAWRKDHKAVEKQFAAM
ncbi:Short-chain dehydrogenase [Rhizobiales bacterium GAS191]|nr:Short-chain dehydrogenase [Rhizobiales bacterium GAS191]